MSNLFQALAALQQGKIIAYPTEAVFGLGCDPLNEVAVRHLLALKQRSVSKGLILIAASWEQLAAYVRPIPAEKMAQVVATWPGPVTWLFPAADSAPRWICGDHASIAVRITQHPIASQLCQEFGQAIVSTSANRQGQSPARNAAAVQKIFSEDIAVIIEGAVGGLAKPTEIRDALTGEVVRAH